MFSVRKRVIRMIRLLRPKPVILMYHRVAEPRIDPWGLAVSAAHFDEQMALLRASRTVMPLAELVDRYKRNVLPRDAVAVTFDDGYVDNLVNAKPILNRYDLAATLFLATGTVGSRTEYWWDELARMILLNSDGIKATVRIGAEEVSLRIPPGMDVEATSWRTWTGPKTQRQRTYLEVWGKLRLRSNAEILATMALLRSQIGAAPASEQDFPMSSAQIAELLADGSIELGGHTISHPVLPSLSVDEQRREMAEGKAACDALSGRRVAGFAYPYGEFDEQSARLARDCGFEWACSTEEKGLGRPVADLFLLPRIQVVDWNGKTFARALREVS
ncbi:polysaccharide deacetylase family protein [Bradyrhizobium sp. UFLA05-109]